MPNTSCAVSAVNRTSSVSNAHVMRAGNWSLTWRTARAQVRDGGRGGGREHGEGGGGKLEDTRRSECLIDGGRTWRMDVRVVTESWGFNVLRL